MLNINPKPSSYFSVFSILYLTEIGAINAPTGSREFAAMIVPDAGNAAQVDLAPVLQADPSSIPTESTQPSMSTFVYS